MNRRLLTKSMLLTLLVSPFIMGMVVLCGCGGSQGASPTTTNTTVTTTSTNTTTTMTPIPIEFTALVVDPHSSAISGITPLGQVGPPSHTNPTNHIYIGFINNYATCLVYSPMACVLTTISCSAANDYSLSFNRWQGSPRYFYFFHLSSIEASILAAIGGISTGESKTVNVTLEAGQLIGQAGGNNSAMDFGLTDIPRGRVANIASPESYMEPLLYNYCPIDYYVEPLKSALLAIMDTDAVGDARMGKYDYDIPGTLQGTWFWEGIIPNPDGSKTSLTTGSQTMAFVYDCRLTENMLVSSGGQLGYCGKYNVTGEGTMPISFESVNVLRGKTCYVLKDYNTGSVVAYLLAQLLAADRVILEESSEAISSFSSNAKIYTR